MNINVKDVNATIMKDVIMIKLTPELRKQLKLERVRIGDLKAGDTFGDGKFIVAKQWLDETCVVQQEPIKNVEFGTNSDYKGSMLRHKLLDYTLELANLFGEKALVPHDVDLTTINGYDAYKDCSDYVSAMTLDQFREFHKIIGNCDENEWLCTAYDVGDNLHMTVTERGRVISSWSGSGRCCVRPFFVLDSDTMVPK